MFSLLPTLCGISLFPSPRLFTPLSLIPLSLFLSLFHFSLLDFGVWYQVILLGACVHVVKRGSWVATINYHG